MISFTCLVTINYVKTVKILSFGDFFLADECVLNYKREGFTRFKKSSL